MSPSDAGASSNSRAKKAAGPKAPTAAKTPTGAKTPAETKIPTGTSTGSQASNGGYASDETNPAGFAVVDPGQDPASTDRLTKQVEVDPWAAEPAPQTPADSRRTVRLDTPPTNSYPASGGGAAGSLAGGSAPGGSGAYQGSANAAAAPAYTATVGPGTPVSNARGSMARRARLKVSHMGPLSVLRISLTFSLCMFIVLLVAIAALWTVLDSAGVFKSIIDAATTLTSDNKNNVTIAPWLTFGRVMLITVVIGAANVIAVTLLSTIGALLYNLCSDFVGGIDVTLVER